MARGLQIEPTVLLSASTLTGGTSVRTDPYPLDSFGQVSVYITLQLGLLTSVEFLLHVSSDGGSSWKAIRDAQRTSVGVTMTADAERWMPFSAGHDRNRAVSLPYPGSLYSIYITPSGGVMDTGTVDVWTRPFEQHINPKGSP